MLLKIFSFHVFLRDETSTNVEEACIAIGEAKQELEEARQVRRNRLEYDALARLIKEHPPRSDTANKLACLTQQLHSLKVSFFFFLKIKCDSCVGLNCHLVLSWIFSDSLCSVQL